VPVPQSRQSREATVRISADTQSKIDSEKALTE